MASTRGQTPYDSPYMPVERVPFDTTALLYLCGGNTLETGAWAEGRTPIFNML